MIELEIYWPYPMVYKSLRSVDDRVVDSNIFSNIGGKFKNDASSIGRQSAALSFPDVLDPLASHYVVLYTAPRDLVSKTGWWTSFPKNEPFTNNTLKSKIDKTPPPKNSDIEENPLLSLAHNQYKGISRKNSLRSQYKGISRQHSLMGNSKHSSKHSSKYINPEFPNGGKDNSLGKVINFATGESELHESRNYNHPSILGSILLGVGHDDFRVSSNSIKRPNNDNIPSRKGTISKPYMGQEIELDKPKSHRALSQDSSAVLEKMQESFLILEKSSNMEFKRQRELTDKILMLIQTMVKGKGGSTDEVEDIFAINDEPLKSNHYFNNTRSKTKMSAINRFKSVITKPSGKVDIDE
jgi:hypothetical protein